MVVTKDEPTSQESLRVVDGEQQVVFKKGRNEVDDIREQSSDMIRITSVTEKECSEKRKVKPKEKGFEADVSDT